MSPTRTPLRPATDLLPLTVNASSSRPWFRRLLAAEVIAPLLIGLLVLLAWELGVRVTGTPPYLLPGPLLVLQTLASDWGTLLPALLITLKITLLAFGAAAISGLLLAILFAQSRWLELSLFPYAVILQTTPIVAIAPLIIIWTRRIVPGSNSTFVALIICAWIVAFFPIVSNTTLGLRSVDRNLRDLFQLYRASPWQTLWHLRLPSALPYFLGGLKISGGLALIGAVVAEFVAGTGGNRAGLAYQILMASYNLQIPRMFAALLLTAVAGVGIFLALTLLTETLLHQWHESTLPRDR
ncbi:MAG: ABC transporter permease [Spirulinaceae cyanobacterium RM2_2_10]|nr:ABC transporter permease [Spirulinaceae cyanobacterium SM2_1_0]NJO20117.1 ABC transporter permease [Spirulinaceae cyanobacterium RM2_2_10]